MTEGGDSDKNTKGVDLFLLLCMTDEVLLQIAKKIASHVSEKIQTTSNLGALTNTVGEGGDQTKQGDQVVENELRIITPIVMKELGVPACLVISEETGIWTIQDTTVPDSIFLIIDPIDGSNNMRPHPTPKPCVAFSIGVGYMHDLVQDGTFQAIRVGLIRDIFYNDVYSGVRGKGAFLDEIPVHVSPIRDPLVSTIGTSLDRTHDRLQQILDKGLLPLLMATKCQRRLGSTALDLCRVATGDYDAYVSLSGEVKIHDIAAAKLIIEEAGGVLHLYHGTKNVTDDNWLRQLYQGGNKALGQLKFEIMAGNEPLIQQLRHLVTL